MFYTYIHKKPDGSVFYVGKGTGNRAFSHENRNVHWERTVVKYGMEVQILAYFDTEESAFREERLLIKSFRDSGVELVNITDGGEGSAGYKWTPEQVARWKAAIGANPMYGKKHSDDTKAKIRAKAIGRVTSDSAKAKISRKLSGRKFSDSHRAKLSEAGRGGSNPTARKCIVNGIIYECAKYAAMAIGMHKSSVARKCRRGDDSNFQYL